MTATPAEARAFIASGKVTPLFIMEAKRNADMPAVPTAVEEGVDFTWSSWKGVIAPKGIPDNVRAKITDALKVAMEDPEFLAQMKSMGEVVDYRSDSAKSGAIIRELGMYGIQ